MSSRSITVVSLVVAACLASAIPVTPGATGPQPRGAAAPSVGAPREWTERGARVAHHPATGRVRFVGGIPGAPFAGRAPGRPTRGIADSGDRAAREFLAAYAGWFGLTDPDRELGVKKERRLAGRSVLRYQQHHRGVPVLGGELSVQVGPAGEVAWVLGEVWPDLSLPIEPTVEPEAATVTALAAIAAARTIPPADLEASRPELWIFCPALIGPEGGPPRLVWRLEVRARELMPLDELVLVDALAGGVLLHFDQVPTARSHETYDAQNGVVLPGAFVCGEADPACAAGDAHAQGAHQGVGETYDFYLAHHGRDSVDGQGMALISSVHFGVAYANAFWSPVYRQMVFGDAYGFALADDVVAHELTHGVTADASGLMYYYESGAINESFSDAWGEFIDLTNGRGTDTPGTRWLIGEDVSGVGAARDMESPTAFSQPDRMSSFLYSSLPGDNGGVHTNSGVGNKAIFLLTDGGSFNGRTIAGLGIDKAAAILYEVQTNLLVGGSDYQDLHAAVVQGCLNLTGTHGITAGDCAEAQKAVDAVEMDYLIPGFYGDAAVCPAGQAPVDVFRDGLDETNGSSFTERVLAGAGSWVIPNDEYAASGRLHLFAWDDRPTNDAAVELNRDVALPLGTPYLHFQQAFGFHSDDIYSVNYHGGVMEYSTNAGASWTDAVALFESGSNGYNGWIADTGTTNPLHGRAAWVGKSRGYISTRANLAALAGQSVRFRWRLATDASGADAGWSLDDFRIYTCVTVGGAGCTYPILDGSFEAGTPNPFWIEASSAHGTPLCDMARCGILNGARTGSWWVGFGPVHFAPESASVQQSVTLPPGRATLRLYARILLSSGNHWDYVRATIDGAELFRVLEGDPAYTLGYALVERDLSAYADGGAHLLRIESQTTGSPYGSAFVVDDVSIESCPDVLPATEVTVQSSGFVTWMPDAGFDGWNLYRGDLEVLRTAGVYTQVPGSNPIAWKDCGIPEARVFDADSPAPRQCAFYLVAPVVSGVEGSLGTNSAGAERPRTHVCP